MIRLFVPEDLAADRPVALSLAQAHYLRDVMRRRPGDEVAVFNGRDGEWLATLGALERKGATVVPQTRARAQAPSADLELVVALVKRARLETIIEKAAELGVRRVRLAVSRLTQAERTNVERLVAIATEAAEQTGRLDVPEIVAPAKLDAILDGWPSDRPLIFCDEAGDAPAILDALVSIGASPGSLKPLPPRGEGVGDGGASSVLERSTRRVPPTPNPSPQGGGEAPSPASSIGSGGRPCSILIGPEGGFAAEERAHLRSLPSVIPVSLGPRILRADTAAIAALSLWQAALGDWRP
jgi:16S rRNA (uracil1498-N3)-methyltransferase